MRRNSETISRTDWHRRREVFIDMQHQTARASDFRSTAKAKKASGVTLRHHLPRLGVKGTTDHSPTTFSRIRSPATSAPEFYVAAGCGGPSRFPPRQRFSPQALPLLLLPLHPSIDKADSERFHGGDTSPRRCHC